MLCIYHCRREKPERERDIEREIARVREREKTHVFKMAHNQGKAVLVAPAIITILTLGYDHYIS